MKVDFQVVIRPEMALPLTLTRSEAKELYDALHAEFGDFDQARELSQLARESVARELRLTELECYVQRVKECVHVGPSLQDDIEAMIAKNGTHAVGDAERDSSEDHFCPNCKNERCAGLGCTDIEPGDDADEQESEFLSRLPQPGTDESPRFHKRCRVCSTFLQGGPGAYFCGYCGVPSEPSNTPEPPAEPETAPEPTAPSNERQVAPLNHSALVRRTVEVWKRLRNRYPHESHAKTITRIGWSFGKASERPRSEQIRAWLREGGVAVEEPPSVGDVAAIARAARATINAPKPPLGYRVVDAEAWKASASMISESEIRELAEGGLERIGLAVAA